MTTSEISRVGFVGLGNIGKPMAERIAISPFALTVFDHVPELMRDLQVLGAHAANSLGDVAERSDLVAIVVQTTEQVQSVILGEGGLLASMRPGSIIAIHSTMSLSAIKEIGSRCSARGVNVLDAAVSGGDVGARAGKLTFMIGGDEAVLERCRPLFGHMAAQIFLLGDLGAGQAGKLANNLLYNAGVVAAVESMRLAVAAGIPEDVAVSLLSVSTGTNFTIANWSRLMGERQAPEDRERIAALRHKDVALAIGMARELGEEVALGEVVLDRIDWAIAHSRLGKAGQ